MADLGSTNIYGDLTVNGRLKGSVYGSTATGDYTKFPDGTMVQRFVVAISSATTYTWTFPVAFVASAITDVKLFASVDGNGATAASVTRAVPGSVSSSAITTGAITWSASASGYLHLLAIGKWY